MTKERVQSILAVLQVLSAVVLIVVTVLVLTHLGDERKAREMSARDSCNLILGLVKSSTPQSRQPAVQAYIAQTALKDCEGYANRIVNHPGKAVKSSSTSTSSSSSSSSSP